jgi:hypothetical protein
MKAVLSKKQSRIDRRNALWTGLRADVRAQWIEDETDQKGKFNEVIVPQMKEHGFLKPDDSSVWDSELWERTHPLFVPTCAYNL